MAVALQISLYPLRQMDIVEPINTVIEIFKRHGLETQVGSMSTLVYGEEEKVFEALSEAYKKATEFGEVVLVATFSNACPMPLRFDIR
ncbi:YKOF-related Family [Candidatus Thermokryptus mobilis]|uniref:YKOF-related Family n=1 Tax=Candidatus Thermokryptus mobilis TaxID=1643428 RepID=A0A0S4MX79_9BACT|nr:YkoF family thiamine/hydroxymethylpyrimidine-binding protein [Candidatus Thermokryptus mobilis]CUU03550.1 YKOF-related Family [Candidatus Thermokryptus mobilis]